LEIAALRRATEEINKEKARAKAATTSGKAGLAGLGLKSSDELARSPEWLGAITAELRAADPMIAEYIKMAQATGKIRTPADMARALGMTDLEPYEPPSELSTSGRRLLAPAGVAHQLREWDKKLPDATIAEQALQAAMEESAYPIYEKYQVHEGDLISAMNEQRGLSYLDLVGADADIGIKQRLSDVYDQTQKGFDDATAAARQAEEDAREDTRFGWAEEDRQAGEVGRFLDQQRDQIDFDTFSPALETLQARSGQINAVEDIGGTPGQQAWSSYTGMFPLNKTPFTTHTAAAEWLETKPVVLPDELIAAQEEGTAKPKTIKELLKVLMDAVRGAPDDSVATARLNNLGFHDEPDGSGNDLLYRIVMNAQGASYDPLTDLGTRFDRPNG